MNKRCTKCKVNKELSLFPKCYKSKDGFNWVCKKCCNIRNKGHKNILSTRRSWNSNNKDKARDYKLRCLFGISSEDYDQMYNEQDGKCSICGIHQSQLKRRLAVDHNHKTNEVRGLLCHNCNISLGMLKENIESMRSMIKYVEDNNAEGR